MIKLLNKTIFNTINISIKSDSLRDMHIISHKDFIID